MKGQDHATLPNLIIAGVHKSGTTSLFSYLKDHPEVFGSSKKEIHYFTPIRYGEQPSSIDLYSKYFDSHKNEKFIMEASPSYFYGTDLIIENILEKLGNETRIIVVLRDPVRRFHSFFNHLSSKLLIDPKMTIEEFFDHSYMVSKDSDPAIKIDDYFHRALKEGNYIDYLPQWIKRIPYFKLVFFEDLVKKPQTVLDDLCQWLDIDQHFYESYSFTIENRTVYSRNQTVHKLAMLVNNTFESTFRNTPRLKKRLRSIYYSFNERKTLTNNPPKELKQVEAYYEKKTNMLLSYLETKDIHLPPWDH